MEIYGEKEKEEEEIDQDQVKEEIIHDMKLINMKGEEDMKEKIMIEKNFEEKSRMEISIDIIKI